MKVGSVSKSDYCHILFSNSGADQNSKMNFIYFFDCFENCDRKKRDNQSKMCEKNGDK